MRLRVAVLGVACAMASISAGACGSSSTSTRGIGGTGNGTGGASSGTGGASAADPFEPACAVILQTGCPESPTTTAACLAEAETARSLAPGCAPHLETLVECYASSASTDRYCDADGDFAAHACDPLMLQLDQCVDGGFCGEACQRFVETGCSGEAPATTCTTACDEERATLVACLTLFDTMVSCYASIPAAEYECDPDGYAVSDACDAQRTAYEDCRGDTPTDWICWAALYGTSDGCDCGCGALDPDCAGGGCAEPGCFATGCGFCYPGFGDTIPPCE